MRVQNLIVLNREELLGLMEKETNIPFSNVLFMAADGFVDATEVWFTCDPTAVSGSVVDDDGQHIKEVLKNGR